MTDETSEPDLDEDSTPAPAAHVFTVELDGEAVLLDEATCRLHLLNATATLVWLCLDGRSSLREIAADLSDDLAVHPRDVRDDVVAVARDFTTEGLVAGSTAAPTRARANPMVCWRRRDDALHRRSLENAVVLPAGAVEPLALAGTGANVWDLLATPITLDELVEALATGYDVDPATVRTDVEPLLNRLASIDAIEPVDFRNR